MAQIRDMNGRRHKVTLAVSFAALLISLGAMLVVSFGYFGGAGLPGDFDSRARRYLLANPDVIVEAVDLLESSRNASEANEVTANLAARRNDVFNNPASPVGGNAQGEVTLVEFFDYNCPYCRLAAPLLDQLQKDDPGLRLVYKEFPILGPGSTFAARAALASHLQGKYLAYHQAMMTHKGAITETSTLQIAAATGLDLEKLQLDMQMPEVAAEIDANFALADALRLSGTPAFVAGDVVVRGLIDLEAMKQLIVQARED